MRRLLIYVAIIYSMLIRAQEYDIRISKITDELGMNIPSTFGIVEDRQGFIWFGTVEGLYRYDGHNMKTYRPSESVSNSISSPTIRALLYDSTHNRIYIGTQNGGLNILDLETEQFTHLKTSEHNPQSLQNNNIWSLMLDKSGKIWIGMEDNQLAVFNPETGSVQQIPLISIDQLASRGSTTIRMLFQDSLGNVYVGTDRYGIFIFDTLGERTNLTEAIIENEAVRLSSVLSATEDDDGIVWIATYGTGLLAYDPIRRSFINKQSKIIDNHLVSDLLYSIVNYNGKIWIGTEYGISSFDLNNNRSEQFKQNLSKRKSLTDERIRILFFDSNGILWIGNEAGVDNLIKRSLFKIHQNDITRKNSLPKGITRSLFKDSKENIWIGLIDKGMVSFDPKSNTYHTYKPFINKHGRVVGEQISFITESQQDGQLWVGDWDNGLLSFNKTSGRYKEVLSSFTNENALTDNRIQAIIEDTTGVIWLATENGINRYNPTTNSMQYIKHNPLDSTSISGNAIQSQAFLKDSKGNFWVGTWSNGLNYLIIKSEEPLEYDVVRYIERNTSAWSNMNHVISLYHQNDSILWIGTFGYGLYRYNIISDSLQQYDLSAELWSNNIFGILPGNDHTIWLSTDLGLSEFNLSTEKITNYDISDGLQDNHFFWGAAHLAFDGELLFGGINGFNSFYPENIKPQKSLYKLHLTEVKIFNDSYDSGKSIDLTDSILLDYDQNFITINYSLLNYSEPSRILYRVKLEGLENEWNYVGRQRSVNYSNLKPGNYWFIVQAKDAQGNWENQMRKLFVFIKKPWWNRLWAIILLSIIILSLVYSIYFYRVRALEKQKLKLSRMVKERTQEISRKNIELQKTLNKLAEIKGKAVQSEKLASIGMLAAGVAHEINNPINFISGGINGFEDYLKDSDKLESEESKYFIKVIKEGVSRVVNIVSSLNQFSRSNDKFDEQCNIREILENCLLMLNNLIKEGVVIIKDYNESCIVQGNSGKLHQAFLNILTNAVQAIPETGTIHITIKQLESHLEIEISDTGIGIPEDHLNRIMEPFFTTKNPGEGTGLGLSLTNQIISEHNGSINFISKEYEGTTVKVVLPIKIKL